MAIEGCTSGHMQLDYGKTIMKHLPAHVVLVKLLLLTLWGWQPPVLYSNDPLWDGQGCNGLERPCCDPPNLPWFCKELPQSTTDYLEVRICGDHSDEDTPVDLNCSTLHSVNYNCM